MKKVIVSGASGQDGSYMCEYLLEEGYLVLGAMRRTSQPILSNLEKCLSHPNFKVVHLDLNDVHSVTSLIKDEKPDYFINFGACAFVPDSWNSPALVMQTNAISLIHILEAVRAYAPTCRIYSSGSSEQWGDVLETPQNEETPMRPRSIYGVSKCAASLICKVYRESYNLYVVHGVLLNHESERRQSCYLTRKVTLGIANIVHAIRNNKSFESIKLGNLYAKRDWSHAKDFILGIWMMMNQEVYNPSLVGVDVIKNLKGYVLASGETHEIKTFVELSCEHAGIKGKWVGEGLDEKFIMSESNGELFNNPSNVIVEVSPEFFRPADVMLLQGSADLIKKELGWSPKISFNQLVKLMVEHDIENYTKSS